MGELVEHGGDNALLQFPVRGILLASNLYEQALLEAACAYSGRIKLLDYLEHLLYLIAAVHSVTRKTCRIDDVF